MGVIAFRKNKFYVTERFITKIITETGHFSSFLHGNDKYVSSLCQERTELGNECKKLHI